MSYLPVILAVVVCCLVAVAMILLFLAVLFKTEVRNIRAARKLKDQEFKCGQCGQCCGYTVVVGSFDKHHLTDAGYKPDDYIVSNYGVESLKKVDGVCSFLRENGESCKKECSIYENRLYICRRFPFLNYAGFKGIDTRCPEVQRMLSEI